MTDKVSVFCESASKRCDAICQELRASAVAPNAACGFAVESGVVAGGETRTMFDLASVTKSIFAVAFARSGMDRGARLGSRLPEAVATAADDVPLELLFAHRAGFPAHMPLFAPMVDGSRVEISAALASACAARAAGPLPASPLYSDIGYLLAGRAVAGDDVDAFIDAHVITPLGLTGDLGSARMIANLSSRAAPTETVAWRGGEILGRVHDENAWALSGDGASGHAGLFGTIEAVLAFGVFAMNVVCEHAWLVEPRAGGTLRAGFDGKSAEGSSAGAVLGPKTFGHLGFTGTSLWIDPDARVVVALLTNRVCPTRDNARIREARPRVHDELARLAMDHAKLAT